MAVDQNAQISLFDALYCDEEKWCEIEQENEITSNKNDFNCTNLFFLEQDLMWDDEELQSLFLKEKEACNNIKKTRFLHTQGRKEVVEWILKINAHYGFSALTAILAVNYLDMFLSTLTFQNEKKPWMMQLASVTCLSLAAKIEETHVPLLLDLQVGGTDYVFEAKTIQRMEILVLSSLKWRMNFVTPLSFIDHIIRRLGFKWEFLNNCENLLLSIISNSRFMHYLPSVLATSTMFHVLHKVDSCNAIDYENQLLSILKINKEELDDCYEFISQNGSFPKNSHLKRKLSQIPNSPSGVTDAILTSDSSNDSWSILDSCISSSPHHTIYKKSRVQEQRMRLRLRLPSLSRVSVESPHH